MTPLLSVPFETGPSLQCSSPFILLFVCACVTLALARIFHPERLAVHGALKNEFPSICQRRSGGCGRSDAVLHFQSNCLLP